MAAGRRRKWRTDARLRRGRCRCRRRGRRTRSSRRRISEARPRAGACSCRGIRSRRRGCRAEQRRARVAAASNLPGRGSASEPAGIAAGAAHQNRDAARINGKDQRPRRPRSFQGGRAQFPNQAPRPGHPPGFEEEFATAGLLARGSSPRAAFPGRQCPVAIGSRLVAHSCGDSRGFGASPAPHSLLALPLRGRDHHIGI